MYLKTEKQLLKIETQADAFDLIRSGIHSPYPVAVWRLPHDHTIYALFDLGTEKQSKEIEELDQCFVLNRYTDSHPPKPLVLTGDVILAIREKEVELDYRPALSASQIESFHQQLKKEHIKETAADSPIANSDAFEEKIRSAISEIKAGKAQKIVLSRFEDHLLPDQFDTLQLFKELTSSYPNAFCHLTSTSHGLWLGASPERLIAIDEGRYFSTDALAGTQPLSPEDQLSLVAWTQKEIEEQAMVSRYIIDCFKRIRLREFDEIGPKTVKAGNLAHLKTAFKVDMELTNSPRLGSTMLELLHPTSAVCGYPRDAANQFIDATEGYDRELYAGFLGPVGFNGMTRLYVNLRCMKIEKRKARLFAGAGITEDSIPAKECEETHYKMQTLLSVLKK